MFLLVFLVIRDYGCFDEVVDFLIFSSKSRCHSFIKHLTGNILIYLFAFISSKPLILLNRLHYLRENLTYEFMRKYVTETFIETIPHDLTNTDNFGSCLKRPAVTLDQDVAGSDPTGSINS